MKKFILIICAALLSLTVFSQEDCCATDSNSPTLYTAAGISIAGFQDNGEQSFTNTSYASAEIGAYWENIQVAGVFGISSLDATDSFWYEGKVAYMYEWETVTPYVLFGIGTYTNNGNVFLEYGGGFSIPFENFSIFTQLSNWDRINYISTGFAVDLN